MRDDHHYNSTDMLEADLDMLEHYGPTVSTYFTKHALLRVALQQNRLRAVDHALEYFDIPDDVSLKERLAMYQLLEK